MAWVYDTNSPEETERAAREFAAELRSGDVVCLNGDLGVGKTAFVKGLAEGLGIADYITSPTFTVVNCYHGRLELYHFDVYRIEDCDEMYDIGYEEYVGGDGVAVIEWAENIAEILPAERYDITISKALTHHDDYRHIEIVKTTAD